MHLLHKQWFDLVLKGGPRPDFLTHVVAYYISGLEQWKHADRLEEIGTNSRTFYLTSQGSADDVFHSGSLGELRSGGAAFDAYTYDPTKFSSLRAAAGPQVCV